MNEQVMDRREALNKMAVGGLSLMGVLSGVIGWGFLYPIPREKPPALFACLESEVPQDKPLEITDLRGRKVLLMRKAGGSIMAVQTVCSHLGCTVFYRPQTRVFECPCHQGVFDEEGNPIAGPPERPLAQYPIEVRDGKLFIQFA